MLRFVREYSRSHMHCDGHDAASAPCRRLASSGHSTTLPTRYAFQSFASVVSFDVVPCKSNELQHVEYRVPSNAYRPPAMLWRRVALMTSYTSMTYT